MPPNATAGHRAQALAADRVVHVRGVVCEQDASSAIGGRLRVMSVNREIHVGLCTP